MTQLPLLRVGATRAGGSGYPNAEQTLRVLQAGGVARIRDLGSILPPALHLWRIGQAGVVRRSWLLARIAISNLFGLGRVLLDRDDSDAVVYVPYPAVFFLWFASFLPPGIRPRLIADAYISMWDSLFNDRKGNVESFFSRVVLAIESRALGVASTVLVDTEANRSFFIKRFSVSAARVRSIPLAIDASPFLARRFEVPTAARIRVLFVGTMIPLHGIDRILAAAELLAHRRDIEFRLIGDGQMAGEIERAMASNTAGNISWLREWVGLEVIAAEIAGSHICLGVFGGGEKAARVFPFKLYYALAAGRAIITQREMSLPAGLPAPPVMTSETCAKSLAEAIACLASSQGERERLGAASIAYYDQWLSSEAVLGYWKSLLH